ncbi:sodium ion-translocating decarboxylase subunit beta [Salmonella enterica subsp. enterica]|nr:sodium ion-translocating decarboxylase subunit beta [Salmonella enterica subsp. enterica]
MAIVSRRRAAGHFMGVGAMTDFWPAKRISTRVPCCRRGGAVRHLRHRTGALTLNYFGLSASLPQAAAIGIIGGADGPTAIYLSGKLVPDVKYRGGGVLYMALVPLIQPLIMRARLRVKSGKSVFCSCTVSAGRRFCSRWCCYYWWPQRCRTPRRCWGCSALT